MDIKLIAELHGFAGEAGGNVKFDYYPAGHMVYLNVEALKELKADSARFYTGAQQR